MDTERVKEGAGIVCKTGVIVEGFFKNAEASTHLSQ